MNESTSSPLIEVTKRLPLTSMANCRGLLLCTMMFSGVCVSVSGFSVHHVVLHQGDEGAQARLDYGELHRVVVLRIRGAHRPADALAFDLAEELHAVVLEFESWTEEGESAGLHVAIRMARPSGGLRFAASMSQPSIPRKFSATWSAARSAMTFRTHAPAPLAAGRTGAPPLALSRIGGIGRGNGRRTLETSRSASWRFPRTFVRPNHSEATRRIRPRPFRRP